MTTPINGSGVLWPMSLTGPKFWPTLPPSGSKSVAQSRRSKPLTALKCSGLPIPMRGKQHVSHIWHLARTTKPNTPTPRIWARCASDQHRRHAVRPRRSTQTNTNGQRPHRTKQTNANTAQIQPVGAEHSGRDVMGWRGAVRSGVPDQRVLLRWFALDGEQPTRWTPKHGLPKPRSSRPLVAPHS